MSWELVKQEEGLELEAYHCQANKVTIGYGNTFYEDGSKVKIGDKITKERAEELLNWYCNTHVSYPEGMNQYQKDAICSLVYNIGLPAFKSSTVRKKIVAKAPRKEIEEAWKLWNKIRKNGKLEFSQALYNRRTREVAHFFKE